jgi:hypothetical protein
MKEHPDKIDIVPGDIHQAGQCDCSQSRIRSQ